MNFFHLGTVTLVTEFMPVREVWLLEVCIRFLLNDHLATESLVTVVTWNETFLRDHRSLTVFTCKTWYLFFDIILLSYLIGFRIRENLIFRVIIRKKVCVTLMNFTS